MAVGKSAVGKRLAEKLNRPFVDLDLAIERREQMTVQEIFATKGEPHFRKLEKELLREALAEHGRVVATGGGAVADEENLLLIKRDSLLVCLTAAPETILARAEAEGNKRPLLAGTDKLQAIRTMLSAREAAYRQADLTVDSDRRSVDEVVEEIVRRIEKIAS